MRKLSLFIIVLLSGCARSQCELAIDNLQPAAKIPKSANIEIADNIMADDGGNILLKNYVNMSHQVNAIVDACQSKK